MTEAMKTWFALDITVHAEATEAIESALNILDCLGTEIDSLRKVKGEPQMVTGFFDTLPADADIRTAVDESLHICGFEPDAVKSIVTRTVEETDWLAEWKKHWRPTIVGKFVIAPPWETVDGTDKIVIRIEPNMAFGTGTHETTQLCLQAIGENYNAGQTFLDVGTGTGILAIAVAKLSGEGILAYDTDADSVKIARENAIANGVGDKIEFLDGPIDDATPVFDFVCANLTLDVIVQILPMLLAKARETLLLSGILAEQEGAITEELRKLNISNYQIEHSGEWISVLVKKNS